jgi:hypothetical protein
MAATWNAIIGGGDERLDLKAVTGDVGRKLVTQGTGRRVGLGPRLGAVLADFRREEGWEENRVWELGRRLRENGILRNKNNWILIHRRIAWGGQGLPKVSSQLQRAAGRPPLKRPYGLVLWPCGLAASRPFQEWLDCRAGGRGLRRTLVQNHPPSSPTQNPIPSPTSLLPL